MLEYIVIEEDQYVNLDDLCKVLEIHIPDRESKYRYWLLKEEYLFGQESLLRRPYEGIDFHVHHELTTSPERFYFISKELSKLIALNSESKVKKKYIQWLLAHQAKVESYDLLSFEQVMYIIDLINLFKFVSNQKAAENYHKDSYVRAKIAADSSMSIEFAARMFNKYRTEILDINGKDLKERLMRFFDENARYSNPKTRRDMIYILDKFGLIKIAVFDFLRGADKPSKVAIKVGELAMKMAERMNVEFRQENKPDLFNPEIEATNLLMEERIKPYKKLNG